jgi:hypothetical protein
VRGVASIFEGTLTATSAEALAITLRDGSDFTISPAQLERSEVLGNRRNTLRGAIVGGGAGLATGIVLLVTDGPASGQSTLAPDDRFGESFDAWKLIVPPIAGAVAGTLVGHQIRTPDWFPGFLPGAGGDVAFGWSAPVRR